MDLKVCPLCLGGGIRCKCLKERCAWWLPFANDCAVPTIAGILADSTICQNTFEEQREEEDDDG